MLRLDEEFETKLFHRSPTLVRASLDPSFWALKNLDINLYDNQVEIVDSVCDLNLPYVGILASRGSGKTYSVAVALIKICLDNAGFRIGIFGPKAETSKRLVKEDIIGQILKPSSPIYNEINWERTSNAFVQFKNGSSIKALSASETATQESEHFHIVVIDEAHRVSDWVVREKLVPMLGSFPIAKTIKIGISLYKNNFWQSCNLPSTKYKVIKKSWRECDIYWQQGSIMYEGKEYPRRIVDLMPKTVKQKFFPNDINLHYDSVEGYTEIEWNTQYEMIWMEDINLVLNAEQQKALVSGNFGLLDKGRPEMTEKYYFGLDTASGSVLPGKKDLDWTVLSILRKNQDHSKEFVAHFAWQGDIVGQMEEIREIIHPDTGLFKCEFGLADYSNIAIGIVEMFKKERIPIAGITFSASEPNTHKNYKNAMVDQFVFELDSDRVKYPNLELIDQRTLSKKGKGNYTLFREGFAQWCMLERHKKTGINDKIFVDASMGHDDFPMSNVLAVWAADQMPAHSEGVTKSMKNMARPTSGPSNLSGRNTPMPGYDDPGNKGRFLKDRLT